MPKDGNFQSQTDVNLGRFAWRVNREIPIDAAGLENLINKNKPFSEETEAERRTSLERRQELVNKLFKAASRILTDVQFQFFTSYYVLGMSEIQIAQAFKCTQPYCSIVLKASIKKIKAHLAISKNL